jgi:MazG family protein
LKSVKKLVGIIKRLRAKDGCPWDREQTFKSLTGYIIEEAYELVEALENGDLSEIKEELGDVLLHVVMLSNMADEEKAFNIEDVAELVSEKMIRRHPHVFGDVKIDTANGVKKNWEKIKQKEGKKHILDSIPKNLPALMQALQIQRRVERVGFDWPNLDGPTDKIVEEIKETREEFEKENPDKEKVTEEFGDILFSMVNLARKMDVDPEKALNVSSRKFIKRFQKVEQKSINQGKNISDMSLGEIDNLWEESK